MGWLDKFLSNESKDVIGLDISSSNVKLVELTRSGSSFRLAHCARVPLPAGAVVDRQIADVEVVGATIGKAVAQSGASTKQAAVAVAGSTVITKVIHMSNSLNEKELEDQIRVEADQYIPYPVDEVNLDFQVLGPSDRSEDMSEVLLAACRSETVEMREAAIEFAGLKPKVVDVEAHALENACLLLAPQMPDEGKDKTVAIIDIGATNMSVLILHDMQAIYTREQSFGGHLLSEEIARHFGMSLEEAEAAKLGNSLPDNYVSDVLPMFLDDVGQQIDRSLQFYFAAATQHNEIDQVILAGGCAALPGIDSRVQERINIPCVVARPFSEMKTGWRANKEEIEALEPGMLVAAGLAMRSFD